MNAATSGKTFRIWVVLLVLWIAAFSLACRLADVTTVENDVQDSIVVKVLGDSRMVISDSFYGEADNVFHKGVGHYHPTAFSDWFVRLGQDITPAGHVHLPNESVKEIMPWLYFATRTDPQNVTAYAVAAFWMASQIGRPDLAEQVLAEAQQANPRDYRVYLEEGRLALKQGKLERAAKKLDMGLKLWPSRQKPDDEQTHLDRAEMLTYRGLLYETHGDIRPAQQAYQQVLERFPDRIKVKERLWFLGTAGRSPTPPAELWKTMLFRHTHVCDREKEQSEHRD